MTRFGFILSVLSALSFINQASASTLDYTSQQWQGRISHIEESEDAGGRSYVVVWVQSGEEGEGSDQVKRFHYYRPTTDQKDRAVLLLNAYAKGATVVLGVRAEDELVVSRGAGLELPSHGRILSVRMESSGPWVDR